MGFGEMFFWCERHDRETLVAERIMLQPRLSHAKTKPLCATGTNEVDVSSYMKIPIRYPILLVALCTVARLSAGPEERYVATTTATDSKKVSLDLFSLESGYVFESDLNHGGSFGKQDSLQTEFDYAHRFLLTGHLYLRLGVSYDRYDFGHTAAPVPVHLQSAAAVIGIDYMHNDDVGAFLWLKPGFYTEEHVGISSFDMPITVGRIFPLQDDTLYLLVGAQSSFLRGGYPVFPFAGIIWIPCNKWRLMFVPPEPRLIYSPTKNLDVWIGGEIAGGSFRTDRDSGIRPTKLNGAQVDYEDYRAGVGLKYSPNNAVTVDLGGGYSIERGFKFHRAGENFRTDPAPYLKLEFKAKF